MSGEIVSGELFSGKFLSGEFLVGNRMYVFYRAIDMRKTERHALDKMRMCTQMNKTQWRKPHIIMTDKGGD